MCAFVLNCQSLYNILHILFMLVYRTTCSSVRWVQFRGSNCQNKWSCNLGFLYVTWWVASWYSNSLVYEMLKSQYIKTANIASRPPAGYQPTWPLELKWYYKLAFVSSHTGVALIIIPLLTVPKSNMHTPWRTLMSLQKKQVKLTFCVLPVKAAPNPCRLPAWLY